MKTRTLLVATALAAAAPLAATGAYSPLDQLRVDDANDALLHTREAIEVLRRMQAEPRTRELLERAHGVLIAPGFLRAGLVVGGAGGPAVLLVRREGRWQGPAMYDIAAANIGLQAGASRGTVALLLMSESAVQPFLESSHVTLGPNAELSLPGGSNRSGGPAAPDVVAWSDLHGAYAGAVLGATAFEFDPDETAHIYDRRVTPREALSGAVSSPRAHRLIAELPAS